MFLMKIGKQKRKFTLNMKLRKIAYAHLSTISTDSYFKICAKRGNHDAQFIAQISQKKEIKCSKQQKSIALTMFYDASDKKYLQKEMKIKGYIMNNMQEIQRQLGQIEINISQYINQNGEKIQLILSIFDENRKQCKMKFYLQFHREDDDNRSLESNQTQTVKSSNQKNVSIDKKLPKPSNNSQKSQQYKKSKRQQQNETQRTSIVKIKENQLRFNAQNRQNMQKQAKLRTSTKKQSNIQEGKLIYQNQYKNTQFTPKKGNNYEQMNKGQKNTFNDSIDTQKHNDYNRKPSSYKQPKIPKFKPKQTKQEPEEQESVELKAYIMQRQLRQKDKQLERAKNEIKDQQILINTLLQQKNKALGSYEVKKYNQEIQNLKKQLLQSNIKISELQTLNRNYQQNHQQNLSLIDKTSKQLLYYKQLAQNQKMKIARIMQKCFQQGDNNVISFIEENLINDKIDQ